MGIFTSFFLLFSFPITEIQFTFFFFSFLIADKIFLHFLSTWSKVWCLCFAGLSLCWLNSTEHLEKQSLLKREPETAARADN